MANENKLQGPYFRGQKQQPCGHFYPDVMRVRDERRGDGCFRVLDCCICDGIYSVKIEESAFIEDALPNDLLEGHRANERKRLLAV